jgi:transposase
MGKVTKRQYTTEFKQQAADLASRIGISRAARQLGINVANVQRWKSRGTKQSKAKSEDINLQEENRRLQKEVDELKKVNMILKRAAAFFSQDHLK